MERGAVRMTGQEGAGRTHGAGTGKQGVTSAEWLTLEWSEV